MKVIVLEHPIFEGVALDEDDEVEIFAFDDGPFTKSTTAGNGTVLAVRAHEDPYVWIAEWEAGVEIYDGAHTTGGRRLFFAFGTKDGDDGRFNFTEEGAKMWMNAVQYLAPLVNPFARNPNPEDGAQGVSPDATLTWDPGDGAVSQNVYLGTAPDALVLVDTKPLGDESYKPLNSDILLNIDTTYYWRIDAVNSDVYQGAVWSFKVKDHRVVDDFESYDITPIAPPDQIIIDDGGTLPGPDPIIAIEPDGANLVAHYEFEGNANDSTVNANHGTVYGNPAYAAGVIGDAIAFDTTDANDYVIVADSPSLSFGTGSFSIALWMKSNNTDADKEFLLSNGTNGSEFDGASGKRYVLKFDGDFLFTIDDDSTKEMCGTDESNVATGDWVHVTAVRNRDDDKMYIFADGEMVAEQGDDVETSIDSPGEQMFMGGKYVEDAHDVSEANCPIGHFYHGGLDDVRIYNSALSEGNARFLAGVGDKTFPPIVIPPTYGPLLAHWALDGDFSDSSGNNFHGTPDGATIIPDPERGQVADFDNDDDQYVDCGNPHYLNFGTGDWTLALWVKTTTFDKTALLSNGGDGGGGHRWSIGFEQGPYDKVTLTTDDDSSKRQANAGSSINDGVWHHVVGLRDGDRIRIYIDGVEEDSEGLPDGYDLSGTSQANVYLGVIWNQQKSYLEKYFTGQLDDVRVYNYALTLAEIAYLAESESNPISNIWDSQHSAIISNAAAPEPVHWDVKAMKVVYPGGSSFARRIIPWWLHGWEAAEASAVTLYFYGDPSNTPKTIRLSLEDYAGRESSVAHDDPLAVTVAEWQEWNVAFSDYPGVDVLHVEKFKIHFDGAGSGTVYFDDIVLHPTRCIPELSLYTDITDDCVVDEKDLRILMGDWLEHDEVGTGLLAHYELEGDGTDSSGNGNDGIVRGARVRYEPGIFGTAISLGGSQDVAISGFTQIQGTDALSICMWAKPDYVDGSRYLWFTHEAGSNGKLRCFLDDDQWRFREGDGSQNVEIGADANAGEWAHFAGVRQNGDKLYLYIDGLPENETSFGTAGPLASDSWIGSQDGGDFFTGLIDDVRIYKRALDVDDLVTVMAGGSLPEMYFPITSPANFYNEEDAGERYVNFKDYTFMADEWLQELLWPPE